MKIEFEKEYLAELYNTGKTTNKKYRFQSEVIAGYLKCVKAIQTVVRIEDLFFINSLHYEKLKGDKQGLSSVRVNKQYRLEFREVTNPNNITEIEFCSLTELSNHYK
jgi:proteic killer suppression protein